MVDALNQRLVVARMPRGGAIIVIVDEAQNLSAEVLEQVRLLTNLETPTQKLLQIILIGQPELRELLDRNDLRQLAQRITGRYHLKPLSREETQGYVRHRLRVAGASGEIFTPARLREVHRLSSGIPRVINVGCDRALLGAYTQETRKVTAALVRRAASEVYGRRVAPQWLGWVAGAVFVLAVAGAGAFVGWRLWKQIPPRAFAPRARAGCGPSLPPAYSGHREPARGRAAGRCRSTRCWPPTRPIHRCRRLSPPAVAVGNGDDGRPAIRAGRRRRPGWPASSSAGPGPKCVHSIVRRF